MEGERESVSEQAHRRVSHVMTVFQLAVIIPVVVGLAYSVIRDPSQLQDPGLLFWVAAIATVDLMPVSAWGGHLSDVPHPARSYLCRQDRRAVVWWIFDLGAPPRTASQALFNGSQIALSGGGGVVFRL